MKKVLFSVLYVLLMASVASATTVTWNHDGANTTGYILYYYKSSVPATVYTKTVTGSTVRTMTVDTNVFEIGQEYTFQMTAYNSTGESAKSTAVKWTRPGTPFNPPADSTPSVLYMTPSGVNQIVITLPQ